MHQTHFITVVLSLPIDILMQQKHVNLQKKFGLNIPHIFWRNEGDFVLRGNGNIITGAKSDYMDNNQRPCQKRSSTFKEKVQAQALTSAREFTHLAFLAQRVAERAVPNLHS